MANATAHAPIAPRLKFRSYAVLRLVVPMAAYVPLALTYSLVSLAFGLPFNAKYGQGAGFILFWIYVWLGLCALGLALEAMVTILTPRFLPFFLFFLIIVNLSAAALPDELQPSLYKYSVAFPMWNLSSAIRTISFNAFSQLGINAGVLIAWTVLSMSTITVFSWLSRKREEGRGQGRGQAVSAPSVVRGSGKADTKA